MLCIVPPQQGQAPGAERAGKILNQSGGHISAGSRRRSDG
jgi:hypothetical protein